ncbi:hypothetical protein EAF04_003894 [Stromatinia cepivora]|nr:hypothetical protein EAF04_003894 [Stromatinia cepivora]
MASNLSKISLNIAIVASWIVLIPTAGFAGLAWGSVSLARVARHQLKCEIREAKSRKIIKSSSPRKFRTFILFSLLPQELQLAIWKLAFQDVGPRTVKLQLYWWQYKVPPSGCRDYLGSVLTAHHKYKAKIPAFLHTCRASREVALEKYKLSFAKLLQGRPVYFDIDKDTLWLVGGRSQILSFPIRLIGMDGFRNLIITPSKEILGHNSVETSFEPLSTWFIEFLRGTKGPKKHIQIVLEKTDRIIHDSYSTDAQLLYNALMETFSRSPVYSEFYYRWYPSIKVVNRDQLDFGGGHW